MFKGDNGVNKRFFFLLGSKVGKCQTGKYIDDPRLKRKQGGGTTAVHQLIYEAHTTLTALGLCQDSKKGTGLMRT